MSTSSMPSSSTSGWCFLPPDYLLGCFLLGCCFLGALTSGAFGFFVRFCLVGPLPMTVLGFFSLGFRGRAEVMIGSLTFGFFLERPVPTL